MSDGGIRTSILAFAVALSAMILEVALTRVFSFITYHHMTYLVIGVAMLGFGAAGTYLTVRGGDPGAPLDGGRIARHAAGFGAATLLALVLVPHVRFYPGNLYVLGDPRNLLVLVPMTLLTTLPFFFAGVCLAELLSRAGATVNRVYFADLVGSAGGALLSIWLVNHVGALASCVVAAGLGFGVAALAAADAKRRAVLASVAILTLGVSPLAENRDVISLTVPPGKQMYGVAEETIETTTWHVITRLDITEPTPCACSFGGSLSQKYTGPAPLARLIYQDGSNLTGIIHPSPTPERTPLFGYFLQGAGFMLRPGGDALVIGSGGGVDVMIGLHHRVRHLVAVDVNPKTMGFVTGKYAEFAGHVFERPDVEPTVSEGRHFLSRDSRRFDAIQISGVDTWSALASGAYALTENFIYTSEAFDQYLAHLTPTGILGFSRPFLQPPLETLRLAATALAALDRLRVESPQEHLFVLAGHGLAAGSPWAEMLVKRSPFTQAEVSTLRDWATERGFDVLYDPLLPGDTPLDALARGRTAEREQFVRDYPLSIWPVTDDVPFYFQHHRWRDLFGAPGGLPAPMAMWVLVGSFVEVLVLSALFILLPLAWRGSPTRRVHGRFGIFSYFASLGLGFILVEVALLQKLTVFLGGPAYALAITLFTLLLASGTGSLVSQRRAADPLPWIGRVVPALAFVIVVEALSLDGVLAHLMGLSLAGRAAMAVVLVAPLGLLLGMPFPAGLRFLHDVAPELSPWAWGINGCATVVGTTASMLLVSSVGFRAALLVGAGVYLAGAALLRFAPRPAPAAVTAPQS